MSFQQSCNTIIAMNFHIVASGSSGNCSCIEYGGRYIFIDAGTPVSAVRATIGERIAPASLFITHEHTDHVSGFFPLIRRYSPDIYASKKTADFLISRGADPDKVFILDADCCYDMGTFSVKPFRLTHDAAEPFGYKFNFGGKIISFVTDLGVVTDYLRKAVEGTEILLLESNYEKELLKTSPYPVYLKKRIAGSKGHLSNEDASLFVGEMSACGLKRCFLAHVSENNNDYTLLDRYAQTCRDCYNVNTEVIRQRSPFSVPV